MLLGTEPCLNGKLSKMANMGLLQILIGVISLIAVAPFCVRLFSALVHYVCCKMYPVQKVTIQHKHDGEIVNSITVDLKSSIPLVTQIALASKNSGGTNNG